MVLGTYSDDGWGYIRLDEDSLGRFTYVEQRRLKNITNPRIITAEQVFNFANWAKDFRFFPKHDPAMFGQIVNPKTGKLYKDFTFEEWVEDGDALIGQMRPAPEAPKVEAPISNTLGDLFKNW